MHKILINKPNQTPINQQFYLILIKIEFKLLLNYGKRFIWIKLN